MKNSTSSEMFKILIASDHAGLDLKNSLVHALLNQTDIEVSDLGPFSNESVDYPDFADSLCRKLIDDSDLSLKNQSQKKHFGILICGSGQGMALRANKYSQIRAALVYNDEITKLSREHNDANVLCLGSRFCSLEDALRWVEIFKKTSFAGGRHQSRVAKVSSSIS